MTDERAHAQRGSALTFERKSSVGSVGRLARLPRYTAAILAEVADRIGVSIVTGGVTRKNNATPQAGITQVERALIAIVTAARVGAIDAAIDGVALVYGAGDAIGACLTWINRVTVANRSCAIVTTPIEIV